jgi:AraC family transcriptional regulator
MKAERIQYTLQGRRVPFFTAPALASAALAWTGFAFEEAEGPREPLPAHAWAKTTLLYVTGGEASLRWRHRGVWNADALAPGTVSVIRRDVEIQNAVPDGAITMMVLQLDAARLETLAGDEVLAIERSLDSARLTQDPQLAALLGAMRAEVHGGCRSGRLYAESISTALLAYLAARYATPAARRGEAGLSPAEMRRLVGYIRDNLAGDISVTELAGLARMSPSRFARVFKAALGMTPYQFVLRERVAMAKRLFATTNLSASQVATEFGFSSQSHFAKVFRQFAGVSPKQYKTGV